MKKHKIKATRNKSFEGISYENANFKYLVQEIRRMCPMATHANIGRYIVYATTKRDINTLSQGSWFASFSNDRCNGRQQPTQDHINALCELYDKMRAIYERANKTR